MGAPKEVWVNVSEDGHVQWVSLTREGATPTSGREPHRYVLARPKREAVAWVLWFPRQFGANGGYLQRIDSTKAGGFDVVMGRRFAFRFPTRRAASIACARLVDVHECGEPVRIVKLVRPVKP